MKRRFLLILLVILSLTFEAKAQRDVPIAGQAANLLDLLKKDYNSIDPNTRADELLKDRNQVIIIFKSFLNDKEAKDFKDADFSTDMDILKPALAKYNLSNKETTALGGVSVSPGDKEAIPIATAEAMQRADSADAIKTRYLAAQAKLDIDELNTLEKDYASGDNLFISGMIKVFSEKYNDLGTNSVDPYAVANPNTSLQKSLPFLGGDLSFTTFVDGLSKFLAKRIKEELTTYALTEIGKLLKQPSVKDPFAEIKVLLPRTTQYLQTFTGDKISNFPAEIKQYIESDLDHVLEDAVKLKTTPRIAALIAKYPDLDFAFEALEMIPNLSKIKQPVDYFSLIGSSRNIQRWKSNTSNVVTYNIANAVSFVELLAYSACIMENGETRFAGSDFWSSHAAEPKFLMLYLGFLKQQNQKYFNIQFRDATESISLDMHLQRVVNNAAPLEGDVIFFQYLLKELGKNGEKVYNAAAEMRSASKNGGKVSADTIHTFVSSVIELTKEISYSVDTLMYYFNAAYPTRFNLKKVTEPYVYIAQTANDVVYDLLKKKYADGLITLIAVTEHFTGQEKNPDIAVLINNLNTVNVNPRISNWKFVVTNIRGTPASRLTDDQARQFYAVANDIADIQSFIITSGFSTTTAEQQEITNFKSFARSTYAASQINPNDANFTSSNTLLQDPVFKRIVMSYMVNVNVEALVQQTAGQMDTLSYMDGKVRRLVFQTADVTYFKSLLLSMADEQYKELVEDNHRTSADLQSAALYRLIGFYLADYLKWIPIRTGATLDPRIVSLIHFANDMAQAQTSDDVEKAIEAFALPAGSYSVKRTARSNFSINSFPGVLLAREFSYSNKAKAQAWSIGFTAPVGLNYTAGTPSGWSYGVFVPVIDVGALTRLHLSDANGATALPELTFSNVFSPGLYFSLGFKNAPFSVNIGGQYGPQLKQFDANNQPQYLDSFRFGIGFVLDIPLFNLSTRPRL